MQRRVAPLLVLLGLLAAPASFAAHVAEPDAPREVSFQSRNGNEWWVQVGLGGADASSVVAVEAQDNGGPWTALDKKSWGDWAASFHVEPGHEVRFVARFPDGGHVTSCWMTHPGGVPTTCGDEGEGDPYAFQFDHRGGNEWWVQVRVTPEPAAVEAMDTGGAWASLARKSWGDWAASFHVEPGHEVRFRAHGGDGIWTTSCWFTHPGGDVTSCDEGEFAATFRDAGGNEWWVQVYADANRPISRVDARIVGEDDWRPLTKRSWGAWAASFHVRDGSLVEFRAIAQEGSLDVSDHLYRWPEGEPVDRPAWPKEGSYVRYVLDSGMSVPGYNEETLLWLNYTYVDGRWVGTCEGWEITRVSDDLEQRERRVLNVTAPAPTGPLAVEVGEGVDIGVPACGDFGMEKVFAYVQARDLATTYHGDEPHRQHGEPAEIPVWRATYEEDSCPCQWRGLAWHWDTGLTIDYVIGYRHSYESGHLADTDAPVSGNETSPAPTPAWPQEGSFAVYEVSLHDDTGALTDRFEVRFTYLAGAWQATCRGETREAAPPMGPITTEAGARVRPSEAGACHIHAPAVIVQGRFPEDTTRNGQPHRATVWWGDEAPDTSGDEDAWWDTNTGLLLRWEDFGGYFQGDAGRLLDTDAPLSSG